jgi:two-component system phosphate regulon sensor histidine kinase PhoR
MRSEARAKNPADEQTAMPGSRLLWQIWGILGALVFVCIFVFGFLTADRVEKNARSDIEQSLQAQAIILKQLFLSQLIANQPVDFKNMAAITEGMSIRITLINSEGKVLADNREETSLMDNHAGRPEVMQAKQDQVGISERYSSTLKQNMLYIAMSVEQAETQIGFVRVALPFKAIDLQLTELRRQIWVSAMLIGFFFLLLGFFLARQLTRPITQMTAVAGDMAQGNYSLRLPEGRTDEIGRLAMALNELARGTEERIRELTSSRNELAAVLGGLTEGVIAVDLECNMLHLNDAARTMLNLTEVDLLGEPLLDKIHVPELGESVMACLRSRNTVETNASIADTKLNIVVVPLGGGKQYVLAGAILVLQDVTEMSRLEQVRRDFVANASHELKTPISAIRGFIETIIDDPKMPKEILQQFIQRTGNQVNRLNNIVQDLIHLSRFDSQAGVMAVAPVDLVPLLQQVHAEILDDAKLAEVRIEIVLQQDSLIVEGDKEALHQMIRNLADNGIKYSGAGGKVSLLIDQSDNQAIIKVVDEGIGIPSEDQQRIFERFYRVDRARSRERGGTGLGLSIVKHIAQSHNGTVQVHSQIDKGSTFTVRIPLLKASS